MAIKHREIAGSRDGTDTNDRNSTAELVWLVTGSDDTAAMRAHLLGKKVVPDTYDGLVYRSLQWEQIDRRSWHFRAHYVDPTRSDKEDLLEVGEWRMTFDTTGATANIKATSSAKQRKYAKAGEFATDMKGAINVNGSAAAGYDVQGVDVVVPALKFTITYRQAKGTITKSYVKTLSRLTGKVNSATFYGFDAGEVMFMGASGQQGSKGDPQIDYQFVGSENAPSLQIGDITGIKKDGHEYLWAYFQAVNDATANALAQNPQAVYVNTVADPADLGQLKIGT